MKISGVSTILFAVTGKSPAVLTETVWCLAHEAPPIIPDKIIVLTTVDGRAAIGVQLFENKIWTKLLKALTDKGIDVEGKLKFGLSQEHIRLFPSVDGCSDINDIITSEEVATAGDFILHSLQAFTEVPTTSIIASVAGGRKTMGVLLANCMVLAGRKQDRLCHVLVQPPYDSSILEPQFYFPSEKTTHKHRGISKVFKSSDAIIQLAYIPFVRVRDIDWTAETIPSTYGQMVMRTQDVLEDIVFPIVKLDFASGAFLVNEINIELSSSEFAVIYAIVTCLQRGVQLRHWDMLEETLRDLYGSSNVPEKQVWLHDFIGKGFPDMKEDIRKIVARIRRKLGNSGVMPNIIEHLVPNIRKNRGQYPADKIIVAGKL